MGASRPETAGTSRRVRFCIVDAAARQIFRKADDGSYAPLNPNGFFLGSKLAITLKMRRRFPRTIR